MAQNKDINRSGSYTSVHALQLAHAWFKDLHNLIICEVYSAKCIT